MVLLFHIPYADYMAESRWLLWLLGPATVAFAVPVYENRQLILRHWADAGHVGAAQGDGRGVVAQGARAVAVPGARSASGPAANGSAGRSRPSGPGSRHSLALAGGGGAQHVAAVDGHSGGRDGLRSDRSDHGFRSVRSDRGDDSPLPQA